MYCIDLVMSSLLVGLLAISSFVCVNAKCAAPWSKCNDSKCCTSGYKCVYENEWHSQCKPTHDVCSGVWEQCGGKGWKGSKCCSGGSTCVPQANNKWYSQCLPKTNVKECSLLWGQCGGTGWEGSQCCESGSKCVPQANNKWYSQCLPNKSHKTNRDLWGAGECRGTWEQCGGLKWSGSTCCESGSKCVPQEGNPYYSQCLPVSGDGQTPTPSPTTSDGCGGKWAQCGGITFTGKKCCASGTTCVPQINNKWYSQCLPNDSLKPTDYDFCAVVVGKSAETMTKEDKDSLLAAVGAATGVSMDKVDIVSIVDGVSYERKMTENRRALWTTSSTVKMFIHGGYTAPVLDVVQANTSLDLAACCTSPLSPNWDGVCVCPNTKKVPIDGGKCGVYGDTYGDGVYGGYGTYGGGQRMF